MNPYVVSPNKIKLAANCQAGTGAIANRVTIALGALNGNRLKPIASPPFGFSSISLPNINVGINGMISIQIVCPLSRAF